MKRLIKAFLLITLCMLLFSGCCLSHDWTDATCTAPKTCAKCGKTEGDVAGHNWQDATCIAPKTCSVCGDVEGEVTAHDFRDANCTAPKICDNCGAKEGEPRGHIFTAWQKGADGGIRYCTECRETQTMGREDWKTHRFIVGEWHGFAIAFGDSTQMTQVSSEEFYVIFHDDGTCEMNCDIYTDTYTTGKWYPAADDVYYGRAEIQYVFVDTTGYDSSFTNGAVVASAYKYKGITEDHLVLVIPYEDTFIFIFYEKAE